MNEKWSDVMGWEEFYRISNKGRVYSKRYKKIMKPLKTHKGYLAIDLRSKARVKKGHLIHRLVAIAFIGMPTKIKNQTNHKDGNKTNNKAENLEWVSQSENQIHSYRLGLKSVKGEMNPKAKLTLKDVNEIRRLVLNKVKQIDIAKQFNVSQAQISYIKLGKSWNYESMGVKR